MDSKYFASLVLDAFLKPFEKQGVFLEALNSDDIFLEAYEYGVVES